MISLLSLPLIDTLLLFGTAFIAGGQMLLRVGAVSLLFPHSAELSMRSSLETVSSNN